MKNAKWILGLLCAFSMQASAKDFKKMESTINAQLKKQHISRQIHILDSGNLPGQPAPTPIRQAVARVRIFKTTMVKNSDGGYDPVSSDVCTRTGTTNVYDLRGSTQPAGLPGEIWVQCDSTIGGLPITVQVSGFVALLNGDVFGTPEDYKVMVPFLTYDTPPTPGGNSSGVGVTSTAGTMDLAAKSLMLGLYTESALNCTTVDGTVVCTSAINETFAAVVEAQD